MSDHDLRFCNSLSCISDDVKLLSESISEGSDDAKIILESLSEGSDNVN